QTELLGNLFGPESLLVFADFFRRRENQHAHVGIVLFRLGRIPIDFLDRRGRGAGETESIPVRLPSSVRVRVEPAVPFALTRDQSRPLLLGADDSKALKLVP